MPQAPGEVEVHTVGVKHDYADGPAPVSKNDSSVSQPPADPNHKAPSDD